MMVPLTDMLGQSDDLVLGLFPAQARIWLRKFLFAGSGRDAC
jgi:hypothetical protein